jgi:hypothetical protein
MDGSFSSLNGFSQVQMLRDRVAAEGPEAALGRSSAAMLSSVARRAGWLRVVMLSQQRLGSGGGGFGFGSFRSDVVGGGIAAPEARDLEQMPAAGRPSPRDSAASLLSPEEPSPRSIVRTDSGGGGGGGGGRWWAVLVPADVFNAPGGGGGGGGGGGMLATYPPPRRGGGGGGGGSVDRSVAGWLVLFTDPSAAAAARTPAAASLGGSVIPLGFADMGGGGGGGRGGATVRLVDGVSETALASQFQTSAAQVGSVYGGGQGRLAAGASGPRVRLYAGGDSGLEMELRWSGGEGAGGGGGGDGGGQQPDDIMEWHIALSQLLNGGGGGGGRSPQPRLMLEVDEPELQGTAGGVGMRSSSQHIAFPPHVVQVQQQHGSGGGGGGGGGYGDGGGMQLVTTVPAAASGAEGEMERRLAERVMEQQHYQLQEHTRVQQQMEAQQIELLSQLRQHETSLNAAREREAALKRQLERVAVEKDSAQRQAEGANLSLTEAEGTLLEYRELCAMLSMQLDLGLPAQLQPNAGHVYALREAVSQALTERSTQYGKARYVNTLYAGRKHNIT